MSEHDDVVLSAGRWYTDLLVAVQGALIEAGYYNRDDAWTAAGPFVASLARQGWMIDREKADDAAD